MNGEASPLRPLRLRELEVIHLICEEGLEYKEIAYRMRVSVGTVKSYTTKIYSALGLHGAVELTIWYWKRKLAEIHHANAS